MGAFDNDRVRVLTMIGAMDATLGCLPQELKPAYGRETSQTGASEGLDTGRKMLTLAPKV